MQTVRLLWRGRFPIETRRGRPSRVSLDEVVAAGIAVADRVGSSFGLREVADSAGLPVMTLYSSVTGRDQLLELMVDQCRAGMRFTPLTGGWRDQLTQLAADNRALLNAHPWLADVESERAILGPGTLAKYERELGAVECLDLPDTEKDAALTLVIDFVRATVRSARQTATEHASESADDWWTREGADLAALDLGDEFPLAGRIGTAAGEQHGAAHDAEHAYRFGLAVLLDGIDARAANPSSRPGPS